jgi:lysophospholipase L1-like esterase
MLNSVVQLRWMEIQILNCNSGPIRASCPWVSLCPGVLEQGEMNVCCYLPLRCLILSLLCCGLAVAQGLSSNHQNQSETPVDWATIFQVHFDNRIRAFNEQNQLFKNVILVGDSITEGFEVAKYFPDRRVLNRGIGGDVIGNGLPETDRRGLLRRLESSIFECAPVCVFLLIGINDLNAGRTPQIMEVGYRDILARLKQRSPKLTVYVQSVLPTRGDHAAKNPAIVDFNARLRELSTEFAHEFVDLHGLMRDNQGELRAEFTEDGLHLTEPAYRVWQAEIERRLNWTVSDEKVDSR